MRTTPATPLAGTPARPNTTGRTGYLARFCYLAAMIGFFYFVTQLLQDVFGWNPLQAGLGFMPMTVVNFAVAVMIPRLVRRFGDAPVLVAGVAVTLAGMLWLSRVSAAGDYLTDVAVPMALIGIGQGLAFAPLTSAGIARATAADAGAASGLVNTFHEVGMCLGLAVLVTVAVPAGGVASAACVAAEVGRALGVASLFLVASLVAVLALVVPASAAARQAARSVSARPTAADAYAES